MEQQELLVITSGRATPQVLDAIVPPTAGSGGQENTNGQLASFLGAATRADEAQEEIFSRRSRVRTRDDWSDDEGDNTEAVSCKQRLTEAIRLRNEADKAEREAINQERVTQGRPPLRSAAREGEMRRNRMYYEGVKLDIQLEENMGTSKGYEKITKAGTVRIN